jgi:hypothetical protein
MNKFNINYNFLTTANSKTLCVIHWYDGRKHRVLNKLGSSEKNLQGFVNSKIRDIIIDKLLSFVNHREYSLNNSHTSSSNSRIRAINNIRTKLKLYTSASPIKISKIIVCLEKDFNAILPHKSSKYFNYYYNSINQILTYCKNTLNEQKTN